MLTSKQEKFAQGVASGITQADAYRAAYNASNMKVDSVHCKASVLMTDVKIRSRVEELRKPVILKMQYGLEQAMIEAEEALNVCRENNHGGSMINAITLRSKLNGLLVDKKEIKLTTIEELADTDLDAFIALKALEAGVTVK